MGNSAAEAAKRDAAFAASIDDIMVRVADGSSLEAACKVHKLTRHQFRRHVAGHPEARVAFDVAREAQTEALFDELIDVSRDAKMDPRLQANRIKVLTWTIEKRDPAKYGQRAAIEHTIKGQIDLGAAIADSDKRLAVLLAQRAALTLPAKVAVASPIPAASDAAWAELSGNDGPAE